ncbi:MULTISPECIES: STAS domain-containing protein [unclassified Mycolicibacterium]|uniref:STAS domain-containing protein n=1 Tax=unclassified Mycolicibacterium TaxID=2636767 RepID=UPI0012DD8944|nr:MULTISPECIES: STAS domain-containing protein [unclassified Mycolicibacterium]MUL82138.1 STAS domain-containing protein [Mycolicibacterium sp. CBMA 329]MUL87904.1 STAS domain-containing protein [Mycolicibacterium sp. CBMA 331]MUM01727.1 STAS domain-containing protein [Mycolicibacterium sp. CBMA 334]MUM28460.1 STAS domain-containing protein [Mycolicibacterium sp. CBMA 295]MUM38201.1 STAS domain-containing protein [Mycolicibacterium sp. CBMA 247]
MAFTNNTPALDRHFRYGNPAVICDGASMRAYCRQLATVVTIKGDVDSNNIDQIASYVNRFILAEKPLALDLSGVNSFAPRAISLFYDIDERCGALSVDWAVIASQPVVAEIHRQEVGVPLSSSVPEALHHFAEGITARRRLLPLLTKSA